MAEVQESKPQQEFNSPELTPVKFSARSKVVVKAAEMDKDMIQHAITLADNAVLSNLNAGDIADHIKSNFDKIYTPYWHCIVGHRYSAFLTNERGFFVYFFIGNFAVVLFKI